MASGTDRDLGCSRLLHKPSHDANTATRETSKALRPWKSRHRSPGLGGRGEWVGREGGMVGREHQIQSLPLLVTLLVRDRKTPQGSAEKYPRGS